MLGKKIIGWASFQALALAGFASLLLVLCARAQLLPTMEIRSQPGDRMRVVYSQCTQPVRTSVKGAPPALVCEGKFINNSSEGLKAIGTEWDSYDGSGKLVVRGTSVEDYAFPLPGSHGSVASGKGFSVDGRAAPFATKVVLQTIFEEFTDGSTWGDKSNPAYIRLIASRQGAQQVIDYLKNAKEKMDAEKVLEQFGIH